jgi:membrane associated rhomboid family serine protease
VTSEGRSGDGSDAGPWPDPRDDFAAALAREEARQEAIAWFDRVGALVPRAWLGPAAAVVIAIVFVAMTTASVSLRHFSLRQWTDRAMNPDIDLLVAWGANVSTLTLAGEPWRLVAAAFLHVGAVHLLVNAFGLWQMGWVERTLGRTGFVVVYLVSAVAGNLASLLRSGDVASVGASGALTGLIGAIFGSVLLPARSGVPRFLRGRLLRSLLTVIVLNAALGATVPQIDNRAHIGGFLAGLLVTLAIMRPPTDEGAAGRARRAWIAAIVCAVLLSAGYVALKSRPRESEVARAAPSTGAEPMTTRLPR